MKKQFVSYKIALALKELGFNEECFGWYYLNNPDYIEYERCKLKDCTDIHIPAPLWQQVEDWFREKHGALISVDAVRYRGGNLEWGYFISIRNNGGYIITGFEHKGIENPEKIPYYHSYEEAREAAILEAIKLLKEENK